MPDQLTNEMALTPASINEIQSASWAKAYRYAFDHSPFYQRHFKAQGLKPDQIPPLSDLSRIPPIDKTCLSDHAEDFVCVPSEEVVDIVTTSGSTGRPHISLQTEGDLQRLGYNEYLSFRCAGLTPHDRVILAVTLDRCFIAGMAYFLGLRRLGASILRVGPSAPTMHLDMLRRLNPTAIVGVPSFLLKVADHAEEEGFSLGATAVSKLICIGDPVRHPNLSLNQAGQALEERWGARVFSTYGNTEIATSLCECEAGAGGHLHPELLHVEVLDDDGEPTAEGDVGELVATTFRLEGMPLIRYRTGDCARVYREACTCGRVTLRVGPITGRKNQKLKVKGTTIYPSTLLEIVDHVAAIDAAVVVVNQHEDLSDQVTVHYTSSAEDPDQIEMMLKDRFRGEAKVVPHIIRRTAEEIEELQMPEGARKRRFFVDLRS